MTDRREEDDDSPNSNWRSLLEDHERIVYIKVEANLIKLK